MNIILFDDPALRINLLPFTFTRPVAEIRVGILTITEKWGKLMGASPSFLTERYLSEKFKCVETADNFLINGAVCPDEKLIEVIRGLKKGESLAKRNMMIAARGDSSSTNSSQFKSKEYTGEVVCVDQVWKIFQYNGAQIRADFETLTRHRDSKVIEDPHTSIYNLDDIFVEEGAIIQAAVLNAGTGPIYIGKNAEVQEGSVIRGPFSLGESSIVNMGGKMRSDTTIGPHCKVGGEISNAVIFGYSNKAHDGFLGNSVLGEWCNLGADTNTSNLKNNYDEVKLWNYAKKGFLKTGLTFCGLMMGDHSKAGINTMFNTGTVTGVSANIFDDGYPRNFIPSFAWGGAAGFMTFQLSKACETAGKAMERRKMKLTEADKKILASVFEITSEERVWEKK